MIKNTMAFTKEFRSGDWYMIISNELPMTNNGNIYCKFDMIKNKNDFWGCPVNQIGTIDEVLETLKSWKKIDQQSRFNNIDTIIKDIIKMEEEFISILENEMAQ